jgi:colicin import membrane protein
MSTKKVEAEVQASVEAKAELVVSEARENAVALFTDEKQYSAFYDKLKATVSTFEPDVSTDKGRRAIAAVAFRVTKAKTSLDKAGLGLTAAWREQIKTVNEARFKMVGELDELAAEVRKPLTEWEEAEAARVRAVDENITRIGIASIVTEDDTAASVEERGRALADEVLDQELFGDRLEEATTAKDRAVLSLLKARDRLRQEEADRAELERLRQEAAEREERDRVERERREAEEAEERRKAEEARVAAEAEERRKAEIAEAEDRARREAEEKAAREREEALRAETERAEKAEREAAEARQREADRRAEEERLAAEQRKREADKAHRAKLAGEAKADLMELGVEEELARKVVLAIAAREVRHVSIQF